MSDNSVLDRLFPPAPPHKRPIPVPRNTTNHSGLVHRGGTAKDGVKTVWAAVYTLELRGLNHKQIAEAVGMAASSIDRITADPRYLEYRERHLSALDQEFVAMKPLAFAALKGGLTSQDENTALRASEQWFKGAGYGGFSKTERPATTATAEDIARALMNGGVNIQVNTQVNVRNNDTDAA